MRTEKSEDRWPRKKKGSLPIFEHSTKSAGDSRKPPRARHPQNLDQTKRRERRRTRADHAWLGKVAKKGKGKPP